jgi:U6 snRNA-associated Sm-like protein LSm1
MSLDYLPGTASLLEELDKRLMVLLRDGRTLIGYLRYFLLTLIIWDIR